MSNKLEQLRKITTVVADTGDIKAIKKFRPNDVTTNPSLLLKALQLPDYEPLLNQAVASKKQRNNPSILTDIIDKLTVSIGSEILSIIPGCISTEIDSRLSFDTAGSIKRAQNIIALYEKKGITRNRVLIKIAATWEGIKAAQVLEQQGIHCNLTLVFSLTQAIACAEAKVFLISPFVGRILDWHLTRSKKTCFGINEDPGVASVNRIYNYYKQHQYKTIIMAASFRNTQQIESLCHCDRLTINPQLMQTLSMDNNALRLKAQTNKQPIKKINLNESRFRWMINEDAMATEKLAEGIRLFNHDQQKLEDLLES